MKTIILLAMLLLTSCSQEQVTSDNGVYYTTPSPPHYKWTPINLEEFEHKTYLSWEITLVYRLDEFNRTEDKRNPDTMEMEMNFDYRPVSSCSLGICLKYKIRVGRRTDVYVTEIPIQQLDGRWKNELDDDSDFYKLSK